MNFFYFIVLASLFNCKVCGYWSQAISDDFHKSVLDPKLCENQLSEILNTSLLLPCKCRPSLKVLLNSELFLEPQHLVLDSGLRIPRGLLDGNFEDLGNYHQCLEIQQQLPTSVIIGKYCTINVEISANSIDAFNKLTERIKYDVSKEEVYEISNKVQRVKTYTKLSRDNILDSSEANTTLPTFTMALCLPKTCNTQQVLEVLLPAFDSSSISFQEVQCRLRNDKPWTSADYVAVVTFSIIGLLTILSTSYDVYHHLYDITTDSKFRNQLLTSFSVYTNTRRLITYNPSPKTIECMDGIRVIAMAWIVAGHRFSAQISRPLLNILDILYLITSPKSMWIISAPMTVDTFFLISGMLVVYTTIGKLTPIKLLKNIHMFYLLRYLRLFPVLATAVLLEASLLNQIVDGPKWSSMTFMVESCRANWWATLLYVQNYMTSVFPETTSMCVSHAWYLAVDFQLHILSPLILFWVLKGGKTAWTGLMTSLVIIILGTSAYVAARGFPAAFISASADYSKYFYINTLTRSSPFVIGMAFGYIMHNVSHKEIQNKPRGLAIWIAATTISSLIIYTCYIIHTPEWDNKILDVMINSFMRPAWALAVGWMILACHCGFGGPVNWFLSLRMWKVPSRLTYAIFILHYPLQLVVDATDVHPVYFSISNTFFRFFGDVTLTLVVSLVVVILIDAPFSTLIKLGVGKR